MRRRVDVWPAAGFLTVAVLGTVLHFVYEWSGNFLWAGAFCAVNESTWEHMKLLFFPVLLLTAAQFCAGRQEELLAARAISVTVGLALIPILFYTYTGVLGRMVSWANILIFYLADGGLFWLDRRLMGHRRLRGPALQIAGLLWLWLLAFFFVWWTFDPPRMGIFRDPVTGGYGII